MIHNLSSTSNVDLSTLKVLLSLYIKVGKTKKKFYKNSSVSSKHFLSMLFVHPDVIGVVMFLFFIFHPAYQRLI